MCATAERTTLSSNIDYWQERTPVVRFCFSTNSSQACNLPRLAAKNQRGRGIFENT
jgi:hypothetical protein